jgi:hypothetical protein
MGDVGDRGDAFPPFSRKRWSQKASPIKAQFRVRLGFFCKQKNALTVNSVLEQFRTQHM